MMWNKKGLIFCSEHHHPWMVSHASLPIPLTLSNGRIRVYFGSRDSQNRNHITFIEVDGKTPNEVLYIHDKPVISPGRLGTFDDCGAMPSWIVENGDELYFYYIGWNVRNTVAYHNSIGLAVSRDGGLTFERYSEGPLFDRTPSEPYFSAAPCVLKEGALWRMWYLSCTKWVSYKGQSEPYYHIKYAESKNGIDWLREGIVAIDYKSDSECGIVRASVIKDKKCYRMWYSHRDIQDYRTDPAHSYRIGYAESLNGVNWQRLDHLVGVDTSPSGWDSLMIEYPYVFDHEGRRMMFYNGNTFGKSGFGYALSDGRSDV